MATATKMQGAEKWAARMLKRDGSSWEVRDGEESGSVALASSKDAVAVSTLERTASGWKGRGTGADGAAPGSIGRAVLERFGVQQREAERIDDESTAGDVLATFVMSTETPDRTSFSVKQAGWKLDNYRANPVLLFAHNSESPPVGQAESVFVGMGAPSTGDVRDVAAQLRGVFRFARSETYEFGATIGRLVRDRFLRTGSVGFDPIEVAIAEERFVDPSDPYERLFPPLDFLAQELLEHSVVPIPANPEAIDVTGRSAATHDLDQLRAWAVQVLDEGGALVVPRSTLETLARSGSSARLSVDMLGGNVKPRFIIKRENSPKDPDPEETTPAVKVQSAEDEEDKVEASSDEEDKVEAAEGVPDEEDKVEADEDVPGEKDKVEAAEGDEEEPVELALDEVAGRCPECGLEETLAAFVIPDEEEQARSISDDTFAREMRRRGLMPADSDAPMFNMDPADLSGMITDAVNAATKQMRGKLD